MRGNLHAGCLLLILSATSTIAIQDFTLKEILQAKLDDKEEDRFSFSHRLLDSITYTFCTIGILLNFFAYSILNRKATMGVLLIKLVLLADGLVCVFYMLNQIWTDITLAYLLNVMFVEFMSRKSWLQNISIGLRTLAVATVSVSNWYIVCMIGHRCLSIYSNPMRGRFNKSIWVFVQKPTNLWVAFLLCWLFSLIQTYLTLHNYPIMLDVLTFVLPLALVFVFSIALLLGLRAIQQDEKGNSGVSGNRTYLCCLVRHSPIVDTKEDSDETFAQTKLHLEETNPIKTHPSSTQRRVDVSETAQEIRVIENEHLFNSASTGQDVQIYAEPVMLRHKRIYSRITLMILSLAVSFLILDSLQFVDLLIRIPWKNILGNLESQHRDNNSGTASNSTVESLLKEIQLSGEKQSVLSIFKNTCTLGKTLTNFLILCAHSLHFRSMLFSQLKRTRRLFREFRRRFRPRLLRKAHHKNKQFHPQTCCPHCSTKKRVRWCDDQDNVVQQAIRRCDCDQNRPEMYLNCDFVQVHEAMHRKKHHWSIFRSKKNETDSGHVVHKLHRPHQHAYSKRSRHHYSVFPWRSRQQTMRWKQPLSWDQGMIFYKPPQNLFGAVDAGKNRIRPSGMDDTSKNGAPFRLSDITFSSGNSSSNIVKCLCSSISGNASGRCYSTNSGETDNSTSCCTVCVCQSLSSTNGKPDPDVKSPQL